MYMQKISKIIKESRKSQGLTQNELAKRAGFTRRAIQYWERSEQSISLENADKLLKVLGVEIKIGGSE